MLGETWGGEGKGKGGTNGTVWREEEWEARERGEEPINDVLLRRETFFPARRAHTQQHLPSFPKTHTHVKRKRENKKHEKKEREVLVFFRWGFWLFISEGFGGEWKRPGGGGGGGGGGGLGGMLR